MANVLVVGTDEALVDEIGRMLSGAGHGIRLASALADDRRDGDGAGGTGRVLVVLADRRLPAEEIVRRAGEAGPGSALLLYRPEEDALPLSATLQRLAMADLTLPLEQHRLLALIQRIEERARATGRQGHSPEQRA